ncbi:division plane positioning ATPase MipZ [Paracoccus sp. (in: a-proteobacteria)]|uniref:division plane positioning ATPase MipZ n=1 Tax=Paracoccus sp. TaxID=267 RepID=UPI00396C6F27
MALSIVAGNKKGSASNSKTSRHVATALVRRGHVVGRIWGCVSAASGGILKTMAPSACAKGSSCRRVSWGNRVKDRIR